jgi:hypothetical protein
MDHPSGLCWCVRALPETEITTKESQYHRNESSEHHTSTENKETSQRDSKLRQTLVVIYNALTTFWRKTVSPLSPYYII